MPRPHPWRPTPCHSAPYRKLLLPIRGRSFLYLPVTQPVKRHTKFKFSKKTVSRNRQRGWRIRRPAAQSSRSELGQRLAPTALCRPRHTSLQHTLSPSRPSAPATAVRRGGPLRSPPRRTRCSCRIPYIPAAVLSTPISPKASVWRPTNCHSTLYAYLLRPKGSRRYT